MSFEGGGGGSILDSSEVMAIAQQSLPSCTSSLKNVDENKRRIDTSRANTNDIPPLYTVNILEVS